MYKSGPKPVSTQPVTLYLHKCPTTVSDLELCSKLQTSLLLPCWLEHLMCYPSLLKPQAYLCQLQSINFIVFKVVFSTLIQMAKGIIMISSYKNHYTFLIASFPQSSFSPSFPVILNSAFPSVVLIVLLHLNSIFTPCSQSSLLLFSFPLKISLLISDL